MKDESRIPTNRSTDHHHHSFLPTQKILHGQYSKLTVGPLLQEIITQDLGEQRWRCSVSSRCFDRKKYDMNSRIRISPKSDDMAHE